MFLLTIMEFNLPFLFETLILGIVASLFVAIVVEWFSCQCYAGFAGSVCVTRQIRCKDQGGL